MTHFDYEVIIIWNSNPEIIKIIKEEFNSNILLEKTFIFSQAERADKINQVYHPIHVPHNSLRCTYNSPITLFLIKMEPKYQYYYRTEGYLLCNSNIIEFKYKHRQRFDYNIFHCSDSIEETKKALKAFDLYEEYKDQISEYEIVSYEDLYFIQHQDYNHNYKIVPLQDGSVLQTLMGYEPSDLQTKNYIFIRQDTLDYLKNLNNFGQNHSLCTLCASDFNNKYVITDGMHRLSYLYFHGDRHFFIKIDKQKFADPTIVDERTINKESESHLENLNKVIYSLHNKNIRFVVIRGFKTMPKTADTDLDIVIHPNDYPKFLTLIEEHIKNKTLLLNVQKQYKSNPIEWYRAYRTTGIKNDFLTNKNYQLDTYSTIFFFGPQDTAVKLSQSFIDYLFKNRKKHHHLYIPNELSEMILLFCRTYIDLNGQWKTKHKTRFNEIKTSTNVSKEEFTNSLRSALPSNYSHLLYYVDGLFL